MNLLEPRIYSFKNSLNWSLCQAHWQACKAGKNRFYHFSLAVLEAPLIVGQIVSLAELIFAKIALHFSSPKARQINKTFNTYRSSNRDRNRVDENPFVKKDPLISPSVLHTNARDPKTQASKLKTTLNPKKEGVTEELVIQFLRVQGKKQLDQLSSAERKLLESYILNAVITDKQPFNDEGEDLDLEPVLPKDNSDGVILSDGNLYNMLSNSADRLFLETMFQKPENWENPFRSPLNQRDKNLFLLFKEIQSIGGRSPYEPIPGIAKEETEEKIETPQDREAKNLLNVAKLLCGQDQTAASIELANFTDNDYRRDNNPIAAISLKGIKCNEYEFETVNQLIEDLAQPREGSAGAAIYGLILYKGLTRHSPHLAQKCPISEEMKTHADHYNFSFI
jgi:hypothetical protein